MQARAPMSCRAWSHIRSPTTIPRKDETRSMRTALGERAGHAALEQVEYQRRASPALPVDLADGGGERRDQRGRQRCRGARNCREARRGGGGGVASRRGSGDEPVKVPKQHCVRLVCFDESVNTLRETDGTRDNGREH
eukprot:5412016-Prymnesium_polylepis.2